MTDLLINAQGKTQGRPYCHSAYLTYMQIVWLVGLVAKSCLTLATPQTVACQAPLSIAFSRQEYGSGLPFPSPGDLPDSGIKPGSPEDSLSLATSEAPNKCCVVLSHSVMSDSL